MVGSGQPFGACMRTKALAENQLPRGETGRPRFESLPAFPPVERNSWRGYANTIAIVFDSVMSEGHHLLELDQKHLKFNGIDISWKKRQIRLTNSL
jgi:hypothetical protein